MCRKHTDTTDVSIKPSVLHCRGTAASMAVDAVSYCFMVDLINTVLVLFLVSCNITFLFTFLLMFCSV